MRSATPQRHTIYDALVLGYTGIGNAYLKVVVDPTNEDKVRNLFEASETFEIEPQQGNGSRGVRQWFSPEIPLEHAQSFVLHRLKSFEDFRLNLGAFPQLRTLVIHVTPDRDILNANFSGMADEQAFEFVNDYIWHARRHRSFRVNLHKL